MKTIEDTYKLSNSTDAELLFRWYSLSIWTKYAT